MEAISPEFIMYSGGTPAKNDADLKQLMERIAQVKSETAYLRKSAFNKSQNFWYVPEGDYMEAFNRSFQKHELVVTSSEESVQIVTEGGKRGALVTMIYYVAYGTAWIASRQSGFNGTPGDKFVEIAKTFTRKSWFRNFWFTRTGDDEYDPESDGSHDFGQTEHPDEAVVREDMGRTLIKEYISMLEMSVDELKDIIAGMGHEKYSPDFHGELVRNLFQYAYLREEEPQTVVEVAEELGAMLEKIGEELPARIRVEEETVSDDIMAFDPDALQEPADEVWDGMNQLIARMVLHLNDAGIDQEYVEQWLDYAGLEVPVDEDDLEDVFAKLAAAMYLVESEEEESNSEEYDYDELPWDAAPDEVQGAAGTNAFEDPGF